MVVSYYGHVSKRHALGLCTLYSRMGNGTEQWTENDDYSLLRKQICQPLTRLAQFEGEG